MVLIPHSPHGPKEMASRLKEMGADFAGRAFCGQSGLWQETAASVSSHRPDGANRAAARHPAQAVGGAVRTAANLAAGSAGSDAGAVCKTGCTAIAE